MRARVEPAAKPTISTKSKSAASALKNMLKPKSDSLGPATLLLCVMASKASVYAVTSSLKCTVGPVPLATAKEDFIATRASLIKVQGTHAFHNNGADLRLPVSCLCIRARPNQILYSARLEAVAEHKYSES